jgi:outer membrane lipoprotein-sorting protein
MGMINIEKDFEVILVAPDNKDTYNMKLIPRETWEELDHVRISIDRDKYHILTVEIVNFIGSITRFNLGEFEKRDDLTRDLFRFSVPEGVKVIREE